MDYENDKDVREQIMEAARRLYSRWGLKKTTMEDIAAEAGKGKATLYYYFKSKYDVFVSVIENETREVERSIAEAMSSASSASEMLEKYIQTMFSKASEKISIYSFLRMDIREDSRLIEEIRKQFKDADAHQVKEIITYGVKHKEFKPFTDNEILYVTDAISTALMGIAIRFLDMDSEEVGDDRLAAITSFFIRGLVA